MQNIHQTYLLEATLLFWHEWICAQATNDLGTEYTI